MFNFTFEWQNIVINSVEINTVIGSCVSCTNDIVILYCNSVNATSHFWKHKRIIPIKYFGLRCICRPSGRFRQQKFAPRRSWTTVATASRTAFPRFFVWFRRLSSTFFLRLLSTFALSCRMLGVRWFLRVGEKPFVDFRLHVRKFTANYFSGT